MTAWLNLRGTVETLKLKDDLLFRYFLLGNYLAEKLRNERRLINL